MVSINEAAANVLNLSASLLKREFPKASAAMQLASDLYFATAEHPPTNGWSNNAKELDCKSSTF
jgi:hypothetical protein